MGTMPEPAVFPWSIPLRGRIKVRAEDFVVDEIPATVPDGDGEHVWLSIRKTGHNSEDIAEWLARAAGVSRVHVGYAGRKDRFAVTSQWFSVQLPGKDAPDWVATAPERVEILSSERHSRKLKTGHLAGNRFHLRLSDVTGDHDAADAVLERIRSRGLPDYFGEQRFGHDNLGRARAWFAGRLRPRSRNQRSLYLSAARAAIFNAVLRRRVEEDTWERLLPGELVMLDGSNSIFPAPVIDDDLRLRCASLDLHPTGPLWGRGDPGSTGVVLALESAFAHAHSELAQGLDREGLAHARRPLRMRPRDLTWQWDECGDLLLNMELGPGEYATGVVGAIAQLQEQLT